MLNIQSNLAILEFFNRNATFISSSLTSLEFLDRQQLLLYQPVLPVYSLIVMLHIQSNSTSLGFFNNHATYTQQYGYFLFASLDSLKDMLQIHNNLASLEFFNHIRVG